MIYFYEICRYKSLYHSNCCWSLDMIYCLWLSKAPITLCTGLSVVLCHHCRVLGTNLGDVVSSGRPDTCGDIYVTVCWTSNLFYFLKQKLWCRVWASVVALRAIHYGTELADTLKKHFSWIYLHAKSLHPYKMLFFCFLFFFHIVVIGIQITWLQYFKLMCNFISLRRSQEAWDIFSQALNL